MTSRRGELTTEAQGTRDPDRDSDAPRTLSLHPEDKRAKTLVRSLAVLDGWLEENEGRIEDEARVRRVKRWREEALEQLGLLLEPDRH
jgi:hypothetical protein